MLQRGAAAPYRALCRSRRSPVAASAFTGSSSDDSSTCREGRGRPSAATRSFSHHGQRRGAAFAINAASSVHNSSLAKLAPLTSAGDATKLSASFLNKCGATQIRSFQNAGHYHNVADDTLHSIQDAVEEYLEDHYDADAEEEEEEDVPEVNYASGVLTMYLPPHGTWVINKQTPNEQLWWSSPISGPRRYEYDEGTERWVYSRVVDEGSDLDVGDVAYEEKDTLGGALNKEFEELFGESLDIEC